MNRAKHYPAYPPGFWRRIELHPYSETVVAGLEDDAHRFSLVLHHREQRIVAVKAKVERYPWSTCTGAGEFLSQQLIGRTLSETSELDALEHCTHLYDLAVLCAAYATAQESVCLDMLVADRVAERTRAVLQENGQELFYWELNGTNIDGPAEWAGRDLRKLSTWKHQLTPHQALMAAALRRAVFVSGVRRHVLMANDLAAAHARTGACYTYQPPRINKAVRTLAVCDFSDPEQSPPLTGFDADALHQ